MAAAFRGSLLSVSTFRWIGTGCKNLLKPKFRCFSVTPYSLRDERRYLKSHEWAVLSGTTAKVGISDYAQDKLGEVVYVDMPEVGSEVEHDDYFGAVESVKAASDLNSPLSGKVVNVNEVLEDTPELINKSPTDKGWIMEIEVTDSSEFDNLLTEEDYQEYLESDEGS